MSAFCDHGRLTDHCEDCAMVRAAERGYRPAQHPQAPARPEPEQADRDMLIETTPGTFVQVMAGDDITHDLAGLPRLDRATRKPIKAKRTERE